MDVVHYANTFVAKPGNIGVRTDRILAELSAAGYRATCVCRGATEKRPGVRYIEMGVLGHVPRLLNAVRIYVAPAFNHRIIDLKLFEVFSALLPRQSRSIGRVAHVWDCCPNLIRRLKRQGFKVVLDVPIAPMAYVASIQQKGLGASLMYSETLASAELQAYRHADLILAPSEFVRTELEKLEITPQKIAVVEFGADELAAAPCKLKAGEGADAITFCFVGTINVRKGIPQLMQAWGMGGFTKDKLLLLGRVFPECQELIDFQHPGQIETPGFVDVGPYLRQSDVFVLPSLLEGSSKAVYEAMAHGIPCIVTSSTGSIVRHGQDGFVVEPGDAEALHRYMLMLKQDPSLRTLMGANARERVSHFTWQHYSRRVVDIYKGLSTSCSPT